MGARPLPVDQRLADARWRLHEAVAAALELGIVAEGHVVFGDAIRAILAAIETHDADVVVMGTHGQMQHGGLMLGSVVEEVVRRAKVPVLTASAHVRRERWRLPRVQRPSELPGINH